MLDLTLTPLKKAYDSALEQIAAESFFGSVARGRPAARALSTKPVRSF